jgi:hypothetical protein
LVDGPFRVRGRADRDKKKDNSNFKKHKKRGNYFPLFSYFLLLPTKYKINPTTSTTTMIPDQTPALKISPIAWQLVNERLRVTRSTLRSGN